MIPEGAADVSSNLFQLSQQVAEQYVAPWGQCLRLVLPPAHKPRMKVRHYELTEQGRAVLAAREPSSVKLRTLLTRLSKKTSVPRQSTLQGNMLKDLKTRGWIVEIEDQDPPSISASLAKSFRETDPSDPSITAAVIPDSAISWTDPLFKALGSQGPSRVLVQAPWPDRLKLLQQTIRMVLGQGRTVLVIVGETERAQWVTEIIRDDETGLSPICFHSGLSDQVKAEIWDQIRRQVLRVVVGTRSSIFLPLTAIGAIWIEGEEDAALKEAQEPRYHVREVAWLRVRDERAVLILSSSHPSLETRAVVEQCGIVMRKFMPPDERPSVQIVNFRDKSSGTVLSQPLITAIEKTIGRRAGVLLFLNRKGYAGAIVCRDCGLVPRCPACRVALRYSRQAKRLHCSYCGNGVPIPETCITCSGPCMQLIGEGTERVEEDVKRLFPQAVVIRLDGDTLGQPARAEALWQRVEHGEWDIIVGTQVLLRRRPFSTMGLVGIVQADAGLSVPDFRSAERTYHTLLDALSLADSARAGGQVIVQTSLPSHHVIRSVAQNDESIFLSEELSHRTALGYPPAVYLIALLISGTNENMVREAATVWVAQLTAYSSLLLAQAAAKGKAPAQSNSRSDLLTVMGPVPSPVSRLRGRYRWQILVKSHEREIGLEAVRTTVKQMEQTYPRRAIKFDVDVDPIEMW
jgi:primosomal protein N' (replication factor Y) (superfamily II helicase)